MTLKKEHLDSVKHQLKSVSDVEQLSEVDKQLCRLLQKHFTLFVGADVCFDSFDVVVKNASFEILSSQQFSNHHAGLSYAFYMVANCTRRYDERLKNLYHRVKGRHIAAGKPKGVAHIIANCAVAREVAILVYNILKYKRKYYKDPNDYKAYKLSVSKGGIVPNASTL